MSCTAFKHAASTSYNLIAQYDFDKHKHKELRVKLKGQRTCLPTSNLKLSAHFTHAFACFNTAVSCPSYGVTRCRRKVKLAFPPESGSARVLAKGVFWR